MTSPADQVDLGLALDVARECAEAALRITRETPLGDIDTKAHAADVVTAVDTAVERAVRGIIGQRLPEHVVVGEEYGGAAGAGPTWYCDPVDGTTNLAAGLPWTSFSLSLAVGAVPLVGVVADPWRSEILHAVAGGGAFLDDAPVPAPAHRDTLSGGVVLTEWAAHRPWPGMLDFLSLLSDRFCTTRVMGSSTLTLAHLAAGRCSGAVVGEFHPEDHLAASLICAEAGLRVWDESGTTQLFPSSGGIMVARPTVAAELFELWSRARLTGAAA